MKQIIINNKYLFFELRKESNNFGLYIEKINYFEPD